MSKKGGPREKYLSWRKEAHVGCAFARRMAINPEKNKQHVVTTNAGTPASIAGGIAVVLVLAGVNVAYATWHAVPWRAIEGDVLAWRAASPLSRREHGLRASVTQIELEAWSVRQRERYLQLEWLR